MSNPAYKLIGTFYTKKDGSIKGSATVLGGRWQIEKVDGTSFMRSNIFLDVGKLVYAPKSDGERDSSQQYVRDIISKWQDKLDSLNHEAYKAISGSYKMELSFAQVRFAEYSRIYANYFRSNAVKFIFDDDWEN